MEVMRMNINDTEIVGNHSNIKAIHIIKDNELLYKYFREGITDTQLFPVGCEKYQMMNEGGKERNLSIISAPVDV